MTNEEKKDYGFRLAKIVDELEQLVTDSHVGVSLMTLYSDGHVFSSNNLHYIFDGGRRFVALNADDNLKDAFFIERDDTVRKEKEEDETEENTEE